MEMKFLTGFQEALQRANQKINAFFGFVGEKLRNYKSLSLGEQIAYPVVGAGILLVLISLILFIL